MADQHARSLPNTPSEYAAKLTTGSEHVAGSPSATGPSAWDAPTRRRYLKRKVATRLPQDRIAYIECKATYTAALEARAVTSARSHTLSDDGR
jgi:hypothetical protein